ncbi:hypothetical protein GQR60_16440 [Labilibaculum sp. A4]|uniref:hypothetical protein n=1 Tax=Labilibaculum euxinus TaxID=2686357 RepID=UPI000F617CC2|nr:hypothetical protein [Labilibaculum euxinus]MDQ1772227.1 hypothetical protein [Labilibaculum euxinus]MWN77929.1 hypothetical protein [Labilibaculum euxinus]
MKKLCVVLVFMVMLLNQALCKNQTATNENTKSEFYQILGSSLSKLTTAQNEADLLSVVNEIKRLETIFPDEWLTTYYIAFLDLKASFSAPIEKQEVLLKEALLTIENLKQNKSANLSEVYTLEGYYYLAIIAQNPAQNGQIYYKEVISAYSKAIAYNGENPRPVLLLTLFKNKMAQFTGTDQSSFCEDLKKIELMFSAFTPKTKFDPNWGEQQLKTAQQNCTSQE